MTLRIPPQSALTLVLLGLLGVPAVAQNDNPTGPAGAFNGYSTTAGEFDPYTANATRTVVDLTVPGAVGAYPLVWTRTMNSRHVAGPSYDFGEAGSWQHSYNWGIDGSILTNGVTARNPAPMPSQYTVYYPDGRVVTFAPRVSPTIDSNYRGPAGVADRFQPVEGNGYCYLLLSDGGKVEFYQTAALFVVEGRIPAVGYDFSYYPSAVIDPFGQRTTLAWDEVHGRITGVTEPAGRWLRISYGTPINAGYSVITGVQAGYGSTVTQSVTYSYSGFAAGGYTYTTLTGVSYSDGTSASYTYQQANTYPNTGPPLIQTCNDVRYPGPMKKIAYEFAAQASESSGGIYGEFAIARHWLYPEPAAVSYWLGGHVETRGDGPQRTFYFGTNLNRPQYVVPQPYLLSQYTDFKGKSNFLGYDENTYISDFEDRNGNLTNFTRTFTGKIQTLTHPPDATGVRSSIQYAYTDPVYGYYLQSVTDELGHTSVYQRDSNNRVKEIDYPDTGSEAFTYNTFGEVLTHKMTSGGTESFTYDGRGLKQDYRDPYHDPINKGGKPTFWHQYDSIDRVSGITDSRGSGPGDLNYTTNYAYNQRGQLTTTTHPIDAVTGARYTIVNAYNPDSTLASVTDERGNTTSYGYDDYKRLTSTTAPPAFSGDTGPRTTNYYYDRTGGTATDYTHTDNNVWLVITPLGNRRSTRYDQNFWKSSVTIGNGVEAGTTSYTYDAVGNLKTVIEPANQRFGVFTQYFYDARNRLIGIDTPDTSDRNAAGHTVSWTYDQAGNKKSQLRANNQLITFDQYDAMNRLQLESIQRDTDVVDHLAFTYDTAGNLRTYVDGRQKTYTYSYDLLNRRFAIQYPKNDSGTVTIEEYLYDDVGNVYEHLDRSGAAKVIDYDNRNRETHFYWTTVPPNTHGDRSISYDPAGNVTHMAAGVDTIDFAYDFRNRKTSETQTSGGIQVSWTVGYTYDADSNRKTITYPSGSTFTYNYNSRDQLANEADASSPIVSYTYDLTGNRQTRSLRNGTNTQYSVDTLDRPVAVSHRIGNMEVSRFDYGYDTTSRIRWVQRDSARGDHYDYYLDDQLRTAQFDALGVAYTPADAANTTSLVYDGNGNRTSQTNTQSASYTYTANDVNEYSSVSGLAATYDAKGNLLGWNGLSCVYDAENRLVAASNSGYIPTAYDALGRQITRNVNGQWIYCVWDGWNLIEERTQSNTLIHAYLHGAATDEMVERFGGGTQTIWYYQDAQGNTTHLADDSGNVLEKYEYDPALGGVPSIFTPYYTQLGASAYDNRFLYKGRDWLKEIGVYDYRNRFYHPTLGRFLQPDPIGFGGDARNLYRFCGNDPVNGSDPLGLWQFTIVGGYGYGGYITFGKNNGQWNFGGFVGAADGLAVGYVPGSVPSQQPGLDVGYLATGEVGAYAAGVNLTGHGGTLDTYASASASAIRHGGGIGDMGVRITPDGIHSEQPSIVVGGAAFVGIGAIRYTEAPNAPPPPISPPPPDVDSVDCGPNCATAAPVVVTGTDPNAYGSQSSYGYIGQGVAGGMYRYPGASAIPGSTMQPTGMNLSLGAVNGMLLGGWGSNVPAAAEDGVFWSMTFNGFR